MDVQLQGMSVWKYVV